MLLRPLGVTQPILCSHFVFWMLRYRHCQDLFLICWMRSISALCLGHGSTQKQKLYCIAVTLSGRMQAKPSYENAFPMQGLRRLFTQGPRKATHKYPVKGRYARMLELTRSGMGGKEGEKKRACEWWSIPRGSHQQAICKLLSTR